MARCRCWKRFALSLLVAAALVVGAAFVAAAADIPDQANDSETPSVGWFIVDGLSLGQEFVPELSEVGFAEIFVENPANAEMGQVQIEIRLDSLEGTSLGSSNVVEVPPQYHGLVRCEFAPAVSVSPAERHVMVVHNHWYNSVYVFTTTFDLYTPGRLFVDAEPLDTEDAWFREGVVTTGSAELTGTWGAIRSLYR